MRVICALVLTVAASAAFAASDFEVTNSNVQAYPAKSQLSKGTRISVPEGGEINLIDRTGGAIATRKCSGKYDGPIEKCHSKTSHGGSDSPAATGATRGIRKPTTPQQ
jgi:hypothetical protein